MRIGKWDITFLFSLFCSLIINSGMVGVVVLHTQPPTVVNLRTWRPRAAPPRVSEAPAPEPVYTPDIPPPPPPTKPPPQEQPKPKVEFDPREAFGERNGQGEALDSSPGERPLMSQLGPQVQAYLGRNPPHLAGGGGGAAGQGGQAGSAGKPGQPARVMIGAASPAEASAPRMTAEPKLTAKPQPAPKPEPAPKPQSAPKPNPALAKSAAPPVPPPESSKQGKDTKEQTAIARKGDQKIDVPEPKVVVAVEQTPLANQPAPPQPKQQLAQATPFAPPAPKTDTPPNSPPTQPADASTSPTQAAPTPAPTPAPPAAQPVRIAMAENPQAQSANPANPGRPGKPGPPGVPAPPGPPDSTPDAAPASDKDSDPFSDVNSFKFENGQVHARNGRQVKPVRPRLSDAGWLDARIMGHAIVTFLAEVDENGNVTRVRLYRTSGSDNIDLPCEQALNQWWIEPSKDKNGKPVRDVVSVTFGIY